MQRLGSRSGRISEPAPGTGRNAHTVSVGYRHSLSDTVLLMREFLRGLVRLHILHHAARGEIHGAWMSEELAHHGYRISPGSLRPTLHKMESEGLLPSRTQIVEGRSRRSYSITHSGQRVLKETIVKVRKLADEVLGVQGS